MQRLVRLLHSSGGLVYHLRAWRWRGRLWRPYLDQVAAWLLAWRPQARHLVLIGPSGGYALPAAFLGGFERLTAYEPDPLARSILKWRFPASEFAFAGALSDPADLARRHPDAAVLFCNLLGQDWHPGPAEAWRARLVTALRGLEWASFHDIASTDRPPDAMPLDEIAAALPFEALIGLFWRHGEIVVEDHETHGLFPDAPRAYAIWNLRPGRFHLVEWLRG